MNSIFKGIFVHRYRYTLHTSMDYSYFFKTFWKINQSKFVYTPHLRQHDHKNPDPTCQIIRCNDKIGNKIRWRHYYYLIGWFLKQVFCFLGTPLLRSEPSASRRSACGWRCTATLFSMTATWNMSDGRYTIGWGQPPHRLVVVVVVFLTFLQHLFERLFMFRCSAARLIQQVWWCLHKPLARIRNLHIF